MHWTNTDASTVYNNDPILRFDSCKNDLLYLRTNLYSNWLYLPSNQKDIGAKRCNHVKISYTSKPWRNNKKCNMCVLQTRSPHNEQSPTHFRHTHNCYTMLPLPRKLSFSVWWITSTSETTEVTEIIDIWN